MLKISKIPDRKEFKIGGRRKLYKKYGSYNKKENASRMARTLRKDKFKARVVKTKDKHTVYYHN